MHLANELGLLHAAELELADALRLVAEGHAPEPDVFQTCRMLAGQCEAHAERLGPFVERYGEDAPSEPERLRHDLFGEGTRSGGLGLLRDLQDVYLLATACDVAWTLVGQAARALRDRELLATVDACSSQTEVQLRWLRTRMKQAAPQALVVARD